MQSLYIIYMCSQGKRIRYEFQRYLTLKLIQPSFQIVIFCEREWLYKNGNDACYVCVLFICFCFLLRLIYSALHRYMKLARYAGQLDTEEYVQQYFQLHFNVNRVLFFINGNMQFVANFVHGIVIIFVKFYQETLSIIQNKCQLRSRQIDYFVLLIS